jgi:hypothetical protein
MIDCKPITPAAWKRLHTGLRAKHRPICKRDRLRAKQRRWYWRHKVARILANQGTTNAPAAP